MTQDSDPSVACAAALPLLVAGAQSLGIELDAVQQRRFTDYCRLLVEGNRRANLTGIREPQTIMHRLILDSLTLVPALPSDLTGSARGVNAIDVGAGAGLPGVPLAIVRPSWTVLLLESIGKKTSFLEKAAAALGLANVKVLQARAEEIGAKPPWRDSADLCTARAVASLDVLLEYCAPLVRTGGWLVFQKSGDIEAEIAQAGPAAKTLRVGLERVVPVPEDLGLGANRATVVYRKVAPTPPGYPRRIGLARTRPLGRE